MKGFYKMALPNIEFINFKSDALLLLVLFFVVLFFFLTLYFLLVYYRYYRMIKDIKKLIDDENISNIKKSLNMFNSAFGKDRVVLFFKIFELIYSKQNDIFSTSEVCDKLLFDDKDKKHIEEVMYLNKDLPEYLNIKLTKIVDDTLVLNRG